MGMFIAYAFRPERFCFAVDDYRPLEAPIFPPELKIHKKSNFSVTCVLSPRSADPLVLKHQPGKCHVPAMNKTTETE